MLASVIFWRLAPNSSQPPPFFVLQFAPAANFDSNSTRAHHVTAASVLRPGSALPWIRVPSTPGEMPPSKLPDSVGRFSFILQQRELSPGSFKVSSQSEKEEGRMAASQCGVWVVMSLLHFRFAIQQKNLVSARCAQTNRTRPGLTEIYYIGERISDDDNDDGKDVAPWKVNQNQSPCSSTEDDKDGVVFPELFFRRRRRCKGEVKSTGISSVVVQTGAGL